MEASPKDWLWWLDCLESELARLIPDSNVYVAFTIRDENREIGTQELADFPFGKAFLNVNRCIPKYRDEDGALWFGWESDGIDFAVQWDWEAGWCFHSALPAGASEEADGVTLFRDTLAWRTWYYLKYETGQEKKKVRRRLQERLLDVEAGILECCHEAPEALRATIGNLSAFGCWPTALFYLSMKRSHPLLDAFGMHAPNPSEPDERVIMLKPDLLTATKYAFDMFRQILRSCGSETVQPGRSNNHKEDMRKKEFQTRPWENHTSVQCACHLSNQETIDALHYWYGWAGELESGYYEAEYGSTQEDQHFMLVSEWIGLWAAWMGLSSQTFREAAKIYHVFARMSPDVSCPESVYRLELGDDGPTPRDIETLREGMEIFGAIRAEMIRAVAVARIDRSSASQSNETKVRGDGTTPTPGALSKEALAIAALKDHPDWTDKEIAKAAGCHSKSLYRMKGFMKAKAALRQGRANLPRGSKSADGSIEAWDESDDDHSEL